MKDESSVKLTSALSQVHDEDLAEITKLKALAAHDHDDEEAKIKALQDYINGLEGRIQTMTELLSETDRQRTLAQDNEEKLEARLLKAKDEIELLRTENNTLLQDIHRIEEIDEQDKETSLHTLSDKIGKTKQQVTKQTSTIHTLQNKVTKLQSELSTLQVEYKRIQEEFTAVKDQLQSKTTELQILSTNFDTLQHEKDVLMATHAMAEQEYNLTNQQQLTTIQFLQDEVNDLRNQADASTIALQDNFKQLATADARAVEAETKLQTAMETLQTLTTIKNENQQLQDQLRNYESQNASLLVDRETVRSENAVLLAKVAELEAPKAPVSPFKEPTVINSSSPSSPALNDNAADAAMMALAGGGSHPIASPSKDDNDEINNLKSNDDNQDINVQAYDTIPALRGLITILQGQLAEAQAMANSSEQARDSALQRAITAETEIAALNSKIEKFSSSIQAYEIKARSAEARADAAKLETESVRSSLASAQSLLMDCERRTASAEATAASATENIKFMQAEKERAEMECRVLQTQLDMALTGPMTGNAAVIARQTEASKAVTERLQLADASLREARTEIERLQKALTDADNRIYQMEEQRAVERGADVASQKQIQASKAEVNVRLAEVMAEAKALHDLTTKLQAELTEARHNVREAYAQRDAAQANAENIMNDAVRALSSALGVPVTAEMIKSGRYPITPSVNETNNNNNTVKEDILSREVNAAAAQLKLVTLQKSAMAKELAQVYKAVEVLENNLGKTRTENKRLHDALTETNRRLLQNATAPNSGKKEYPKEDTTIDAVSPPGSRTRGIAPGVLSAMRSVFADYSNVATSPIVQKDKVNDNNQDESSSASVASSVGTDVTPSNVSIRGTTLPITALSTPSAYGGIGGNRKLSNYQPASLSNLSSPSRSLQEESNRLRQLSGSRILEQQRLLGKK